MSETEFLSSSTNTSSLANVNQREPGLVSESNQNATKQDVLNVTKQTNRQKNNFTKLNQSMNMKNESTWNEFNRNFNYQFQPIVNKEKIFRGQQLRPTAHPFNYNSDLKSLYNSSYPVPISFSNQIYPTNNSFEMLQPSYIGKSQANINNIRPFVPKFKQRSNKTDKNQNSAENVTNMDNAEKKEPEQSEYEEKKAENELGENSSNKKELNSETTTITGNTTNTKMPMCLVHELVKYNKIKHEYVLLDEIGPAHKKKFYVALKLGVGTEQEETFSSNGSSIKKAQHAAAEIALKNSKFKRPEPKTDRINAKLQHRTRIDTKDANENADDSAKVNNSATYKNRTKAKKPNTLAPTVLLNTLAMKLGLKAKYAHITTTSLTTNPNDVQKEEELGNGTEPISSIQAQTNDVTLNNSFDSSDNYINFNKTQHEPFKYPSSQIYLYPTYMQQFNNSSSFNTALPNKSSNLFKTGKMSKIRRFTLNQQQIGDADTNSLYSKQFDVYKVELKFADCTFDGEGRTLQMAKHDAASKALSYFTDVNNFLKAKELSDKVKVTQAKSNRTQTADKNDEVEDLHGENTEKSTKTIDTKPNQKETKPDENRNQAEQQQQMISEINLVQEYACRLKKSIKFELVQESGPSHIKHFVSKCVVSKLNTTSDESDKKEQVDQESLTSTNQTTPVTDSFETFGEGNSKKLSKKNAAIAMLKILHEHFEPILILTSKSVKNSTANSNGKSNNNGKINNINGKDKQEALKVNEKQRKPKMASIVKSKKINPEYGKGSINPITRLIQIQHGINEQEPVFELLNETPNVISGNKAKPSKQFVMQVTIQRKKAQTASITTISNHKKEQNQQFDVSDYEILKSEGRGATKKLAKTNAAQAMLVQLGYSTSNQPVQSVLKSSVKSEKKSNEPISTQFQETTSNKESNTETSPTSNITSHQDENCISSTPKHQLEKKVKFSEEIDTEGQKMDQANKIDQNGAKKMLKKNQTSMSTTANKNADSLTGIRIKNMKDQFMAKRMNQTKIKEKSVASEENLKNVYKIAYELLESVNKSENSGEFKSETAKLLLREASTKNVDMSKKEDGEVEDDDDELSDSEKHLEDMKFHILNGGTTIINYKKMLDYLAKCMHFEVNYQSLLGRDGSILSYIRLNNLANLTVDKPLNGQGVTFVESSNVAALNTLKYLASKNE